MSGFILKYGSYAHQPGEASLQISKNWTYDEKKAKSLETRSWTIDGLLIGTSVADMKTKIAALEAAYSTNGLDLILYQGDGVTETAHVLKSFGSEGGVRVDSIDFPSSQGPEHLTYRTYRISVSADYAIVGRRELIFFHETVSTSGGGERHVWQETMTGPPVKQTVAKQTVYLATQSGSAIGNKAYPTVPRPLFPEHQDGKVKITKDGPKEVAPGVYKEFQIAWEYNFIHKSKLQADPNKGT